jgi:hypothetical protein
MVICKDLRYQEKVTIWLGWATNKTKSHDLLLFLAILQAPSKYSKKICWITKTQYKKVLPTTLVGSRVNKSRVATADQVRHSKIWIYKGVSIEIHERTTLTLSSQPPTARNSPVGCHATARMPRPGSRYGVNEDRTLPLRVSICSLYLQKFRLRW